MASKYYHPDSAVLVDNYFQIPIYRFKFLILENFRYTMGLHCCSRTVNGIDVCHYFHYFPIIKWVWNFQKSLIFLCRYFIVLVRFKEGLMLSDIVDISVSWFLTRRPPFLLPGDASWLTWWIRRWLISIVLLWSESTHLTPTCPVT